jgi:hypothetical protein
MARVLRDRNKRDQAPRLLVSALDSSTEGFETPNLVGAEVLLDALAR